MGGITITATTAEGTSPRGIRAYASTYAGYFQETDSLADAYIGYSGYSIYANDTIYTSGGLIVNNSIAQKTAPLAWTLYSDERLKDVKGDFTRGLDEITELQPVYYNFKKDNAINADSEQTFVGLVAQDVQEVIPEATAEGEMDT